MDIYVYACVYMYVLFKILNNMYTTIKGKGEC